MAHFRSCCFPMAYRIRILRQTIKIPAGDFLSVCQMKVCSLSVIFRVLDFLSLVPVESYLRLLNCLSDCYTAFFDFDQFEDLKRAIQKLIKLPAPANMYQHVRYLWKMFFFLIVVSMILVSLFKSNLSSKILQVILLQALPSELATNFLATLAESTRSSFTDFDSNITKLRQSNFSRLPMQKPAAKVVGAFISPLPWLKPLIPVIEVNNVTEKFGLLFTGVSVHLTQYYLYLLHIRNKNDFMVTVIIFELMELSEIS